MTPSYLKYMNSVLFAFILRSMPSAACSKLCCLNFAWAGLFARSARSSASI